LASGSFLSAGEHAAHQCLHLDQVEGDRGPAFLKIFMGAVKIVP